MEQRATKTYLDGGIRKSFYHPYFKSLFEKKADELGGRRKVGDLTDKLCEALVVSPDTVKAWRYGRNAPVDLETVSKIAEFFEVDVEPLLTDEEEEKMDRLVGGQLDAVSRVYKEIEDYADLFNHIDFYMWESNKKIKVKNGTPFAQYATFWFDYTGEMNDYEFDDLYDLADRGQRWVCHALEREWVHLGSHQVFGELAEFIDESLWRLWDIEHDSEVEDGESKYMSPELVVKEAREIICKYL